MNRITAITGGAILILLMFALWAYLFMYGAPEKPLEVFSNLGIIDKTQDGTVRTIDTLPQIPKDATRLSLGNAQLEQITTRVVAGFEITGTSETVLLYAERGTGHIFEIDLATGLERQRSLTTIPGAVEVLFSPEGSRVAFITHSENKRVTQVGSLLRGQEIERIGTLREDAYDVHFIDEQTVRYARAGAYTTTIYSRNLDTLEEVVLQELPFSDAHIDATSPVVTFAPKIGRGLFGALYFMEGKKLKAHTAPFEGFAGFMHNTIPVFSYTDTNQTRSGAAIGDTVVAQGIPLLREKCTQKSGTVLWCAAPLSAPAEYILNWYKGIQNSEDYLWEVDLPTGEATLIGDLPELALKTLDVLTLKNDNNKRLLFINKIDGSLWLFRLAE